ncbi:MAG: cupin domain-containing protein [Acholeplasmatales bacterium]|jgi:transcriptional regulator with XRE-family HTH domain|nr:cupin domain-containing protein [Acholeplasmatales bacterium]
MDIGRKLRELRQFNNLTQDELADRLHLTKGCISQFENNVTYPSLDTLFKYLEVLGTDVKEFFGNTDDEKVVFHEDEFIVKEDKDLLIKTTYIAPSAMRFEMEPILLSIDTGGRTHSINPHPGEQFGYVLMGQITLVLGKRRLTVKKGETFYFLSNKEHFIENSGSGAAKILWISTPPTF